MVQLRKLEKALDISISKGELGEREDVIDEYLSENGNISSSASSKLHEALYKIWISEEVQSASQAIEQRSEISLTAATSGSADQKGLMRNEEFKPSSDARVVFLNSLLRLAPCLINKEQLAVWWNSLSVYAIDSTGYRLDLVNLSKQFITGVLTSSFYGYGDASNSKLYTELACSYGRPALELYLSNQLPKKTGGEHTDERTRFVRQNCRSLFGKFARKETKAAFSMLNEYFIQHKHRIDILDLVVEYLAESQNSKLFRVYETPFFESLLICLERDRTKPAVQLALTALSMVLVHICDKLITAGLLNRIYACFGRACSWQPRRSSDIEKDTDSDTEYEVARPSSTDSSVKSPEDKPPRTSSKKNKPVPRDGAQTEKLPLQSEAASEGWQVLEDDELEQTNEDSKIAKNTKCGSDLELETVDVVPLFTFLYGLFPVNTLQFCRHCDEYFVRHKYQKTITDFWSRFMVTKKAESIVRQFRLAPTLVQSTEESELFNALSYFKEVGSALGLSSISTSRRIMNAQINDSNSETEENQATAKPWSPGSERGDEHISNIDRLLADHKAAFQMQPKGTVGHWHRELLLIRNELAFANFSRNMSEQRALRWQNRASQQSVVESKNEELARQNRLLREKVITLEMETQRAVLSARTILRERSAYECRILDKNREFRDQIRSLEGELMETQEEAKAARQDALEAAKTALENQDRATAIAVKNKALQNELELADRSNAQPRTVTSQSPHQIPDGSKNSPEIERLQSEVEQMKFRMNQLQKDHEVSLDSLKAELVRSQADLSDARARTVHPQDANTRRTSVTVERMAREKSDTISRLKSKNEELSRRCVVLEHELRARKVYEEERLNELQIALTSSRPYASQEAGKENRFRGRGGAQGVPRGL